MDKTFQYTQVTPNFDSAYNVPSPPAPNLTTYIPMYSPTGFGLYSNRASSPLFRRCISPPPRRPIPTGSGPKFNFDLYKMDENNNEYTGYTSPTYRSLSPSSPRIIHHYPIDSPLSSPTSKPGSFSKLKRINDELCCTLARSELYDKPPTSSSPPHYHIHHYPLSQQSHRKHRSRSPSEERPPPIELEVPPRSPNIHKARVTYKIHAPRPHRHRKSSHHRSKFDESSSDEPIVVDLYPTRDRDFVRQDSDNQNPWVVNGRSIRRNSYSDPRTSLPPQTPKDAYYEDKPIKFYRQSNSAHRPSPHTTSRKRPDSAVLEASDEFYRSHGSFSDTAPVWRSNGSITPSKTQRRVWQPTSKTISRTPPKYFSSTIDPNYDSSTKRRVIDEIESDSMSQRKSSDRAKIRTNDPKMKKRIQNTESKIKPMWQPTVTGVKQPKPSKLNDSTGSVVKETKPSVPVPVKEKTPSTPPKSKVQPEPAGPPTATNTDRSSATDAPTKSVDESTPRNQNDTHENNDSDEDIFGNKSHTSEPSKKQESPSPPPTPPPVEKKPSVELPKTTVPEPDQGTKSTIKNGVLVHGTGTPTRKQTPSPTSDAKPQPNDKDNESVADDDNDDDRDENDEEVAHNFDFSKWLSGASKEILNASKKDSTPSQPPPPAVKPKPKSPPRRKEQPPSPPADEDLYKPPFGPKKTNPEPSSSPASPPPPPPPATTTEATEAVDDFFS